MHHVHTASGAKSERVVGWVASCQWIVLGAGLGIPAVPVNAQSTATGWVNETEQIPSELAGGRTPALTAEAGGA